MQVRWERDTRTIVWRLQRKEAFCVNDGMKSKTTSGPAWVTVWHYFTSCRHCRESKLPSWRKFKTPVLKLPSSCLNQCRRPTQVQTNRRHRNKMRIVESPQLSLYCPTVLNLFFHHRPSHYSSSFFLSFFLHMFMKQWKFFFKPCATSSPCWAPCRCVGAGPYTACQARCPSSASRYMPVIFFKKK